MMSLKQKRYSRHTKKYLKQRYDLHVSSKMGKLPIVCYTTRLSLVTYLMDGQSEKSELEFLSTHLFPNLDNRAICLDIGAHIGNHSLQFAQFFKKVISFEPHPTSFKLLEINTESCDNIIAINLGCSNICGSVVATGREPSMLAITPTQTEQQFPDANLSSKFNVDLLDDIQILKELKSIDFIKIDVEGHEKACFEGAENLLSIHSPVIACEVLDSEIIDGHCNSIDFLKKFGYDYIYEFRRQGPTGIKKLLSKFKSRQKPDGELYLQRTDTLMQRHHHMVLCSKYPLDCKSDY